MVRLALLSILLALLAVSCASQKEVLNAAALPPHHLPDGHFRNLDTSVAPIRDTMEADSLVPTHRTKLYALPIVRGHEEWWEDSSKVTATWIGHSTYYIRWKGYGILTDPIFSKRASPVSFVGPKRGTPPGRDLDSLPGVDLVIISHDHYDHLDSRSIKKIHKKYPAAVFAVPLKVAEILEGWGIPEEQIIERDWWQEAEVGEFKLTFLPVHHTSRRGLFKSSARTTLWGSWMLSREGRNVWFGGDLAMGDGSYYTQIAEKFAPLDAAFLPIGSYKPSRYTRQHVSPRQAAQLHVLLKSKKSLAMHWGTFGMVYDRLEDAPKDLARAREELSIPEADFCVPKHGEIVELF